MQYKNGASNTISPHPAFSGNVQGICPDGWHIPTNAEFQTLKSAVVGDGNALKAIGQGTAGGAGTNTSGFSALLAGFRYYGGDFRNLNGDADFWSSTQGSANSAYHMNLTSSNSNITFYDSDKEFGFSVRCLKD